MSKFWIICTPILLLLYTANFMVIFRLDTIIEFVFPIDMDESSKTTASSSVTRKEDNNKKDFDSAKSHNMTQQEKDVLLKTLQEFDFVWRRHRKIYILVYGSLLGMYRHSQVIPFDDNVDVVVDHKDFLTLKATLENTSLTLGYLSATESRIHMRDNSLTSKVFNRSWRWPFINIFYYRSENNFIYFSKHPETKFPTSHILPPIKLPFNKFLSPAVRCPLLVLKRMYGLDALTSCCINEHSHKVDQPRPRSRTCVDCYFTYPKIHHEIELSRWSRINESHVELWQGATNRDEMLGNPTVMSWKPTGVFQLPPCQ